jgi:FMN phosphatase YigB (HAD superfamily)
MITTLFFDLDGTLLPMNESLFLQIYMKSMADFFNQNGRDGHAIVNAVMSSTDAMIHNDGLKTNETAFWDAFAKRIPYANESLKTEFERFYETHFEAVKASTWVNSTAKDFIASLRFKGYRLVLSTNPLFPKIATHKRIQWAELSVSDFDHITTYETDSYCKPNLNYYQQLLTKMNLQPHECLMIGNDLVEDMAASQIGIKSFLLTDCLISNNNTDTINYPHGNFDDLSDWLETILYESNK